MGVQEVRWNKRGTVRAFPALTVLIFMEKEMIIINWEQCFGTPQNSISSKESSLFVIGCHIP